MAEESDEDSESSRDTSVSDAKGSRPASISEDSLMKINTVEAPSIRARSVDMEESWCSDGKATSESG